MLFEDYQILIFHNLTGSTGPFVFCNRLIIYNNNNNDNNNNNNNNNNKEEERQRLKMFCN